MSKVTVRMEGDLAFPLAYGENRRQGNAGLYLETDAENDPLSLDKFERIVGKVPGTVNALDMHRLVETATRLGAARSRNFGGVGFMAIFVKHGNPGGVGIGYAGADEPEGTVRRMIDGDREAVSGGFVLVNFPVTASIARQFRTHAMPSGETRILDGILAPAFEPEAMEILERKKGLCKMFVNRALTPGGLAADPIDSSPRIKQVRGGFVHCDGDSYVFELPDEWKQRLPLRKQQDLVLAWAVGSTSNSNTITLVKNGMLIGNGAGQRSRVMAAKLALMYAETYGHDPCGAVAYSDSFFPFPDGPRVLARAGVKVIFATSGSVRDAEVQQACGALGVQFFQLPDAEVRGFYGHC